MKDDACMLEHNKFTKFKQIYSKLNSVISPFSAGSNEEPKYYKSLMNAGMEEEGVCYTSSYTLHFNLVQLKHNMYNNAAH